MCKNKRSFLLNPFITFFIFLMFFSPSITTANVHSHDDSIITLPIQADLSVLEKHLNKYVPDDLAELDERGKECIKPQDMKVPTIPRCKMKGFKISCKDWTTDLRTVPKVKCDVKGWIKRNGRILVSGKGSTLTFAFPIKAQASADGYIYGTAKAAAILYLDAKIRFNKDWTMSIDIEHDFAWSSKPTLKLFDLIKIDIKRIIEPKLRKRMDKFAKRVPSLLEKLDIKGRMAEVWEDVQDPFKIDDDRETYLLFRPETAACSQIDIVDKVLKSTISAKGKTKVFLGKPPVDYNKTKLTDLELICYQKGIFNFDLPVIVTYDELLARTNKKHPNGYVLDMSQSVVPGLLKITDPKIKKGKEGKINITAKVTYDNRDEWLKSLDKFNWFDVKGEITFTAVPRIDQRTSSLVFDEMAYDSNTNSDLFDLLIDASELGPIQSYFESIVQYDYSKRIEKGINKANKALNTVYHDDINVTGRLEEAIIQEIIVNDASITLNTHLSGVLDANAGL
ncbi:MAG TPA: DUF4403 family protein [Sulfurovum sp.]